MTVRSLEECKRILSQLDARSLEERAERMHELGMVTIDGRGRSFDREWEYLQEAHPSYICGHYRSTFLCCAVIVDQVFRYEYIKASDDRKAACQNLKYKSGKEIMTGELTKKCEAKPVTRLAQFIEKGKELYEMRNKVAAHPLFIDLPTGSDEERELRDELVSEDIETLLNLVGDFDAKLKEEIESTEIVELNTGAKHILRDILNKKYETPITRKRLTDFRSFTEQKILRILAHRAIDITKEILEGLYPAE